MTTFVLLHGMFHGAWCWARVTPLLRSAGHVVMTPTQTGVGDRAHLLHAGVTLDTFVQDVVALLETEELTDVVLVGHSFGGNAISGAAHRSRERIRHLVYLDGVIPEDGVAPLDRSDPEVARVRRGSGAASGGVSVTPPDPSIYGISDAGDLDWVRRRLTPHPFGTLTSSLRLPGGAANGLPATYVFCSRPAYASLGWARDLARQQAGWGWREIEAGHDCMVTAPEETARLLMEIAP